MKSKGIWLGVVIWDLYMVFIYLSFDLPGFFFHFFNSFRLYILTQLFFSLSWPSALRNLSPSTAYTHAVDLKAFPQSQNILQLSLLIIQSKKLFPIFYISIHLQFTQLTEKWFQNRRKKRATSQKLIGKRLMKNDERE